MLWEINQINEYHIKKVIWNMFKTHIMKKKWSSLATNKPKFEQQNFFFATKLVKQTQDKSLKNIDRQLYLNLKLMFNICILNFKIIIDIKTTINKF